ncbi:MarR family transcriptional regulator [Rhizobium sp. S152]|uniref:MarR family winged helix-turn-helix transcriptional regulator n=1 Tax=Rhizobium sp. S152 TaxID=3055038 RepID=UPI0025A97CAA|nr:MarR family transcriptional regulator [Rhizobium sp. S152]MDM9628147.1 MarR family transcriptional regulator [Rhizobium sp. S152]
MANRKTTSALDEHLGYWLRMVSNHVSNGFARKLEGHGATVAEWVLLRELFDVEALAPSRLAERMGMTRGAISKLADRLTEKKLVARADDPDDQRAHRLSLTVAGRELVPELAALADENDASFFADLTALERANIEAILRKIVVRRGLKDIPVS